MNTSADTVPCPVKGCNALTGEPCWQALGVLLPTGVFHNQRHLDALVVDGHTHTDTTISSFCRECARLAYNRITGVKL